MLRSLRSLSWKWWMAKGILNVWNLICIPQRNRFNAFIFNAIIFVVFNNSNEIFVRPETNTVFEWQVLLVFMKSATNSKGLCVVSFIAPNLLSETYWIKMIYLLRAMIYLLSLSALSLSQINGFRYNISHCRTLGLN